MKFLGIDYGTRRVGVAISDSAGEFSFARAVLDVTSDAEAVAAVCRVAREEEVDAIVVGMPRNMDGTSGAMVEIVNAFVSKLGAESGLPIETWDERLTTAGVEKQLVAIDMSRARRKQVRDKLAAQAVLQGFLDARQSGGRDTSGA